MQPITRTGTSRRLPVLAALALLALAVWPIRPAAAGSAHVAGFVVLWDDGTSQRTWLRDYQGYVETYFDTALLMAPNHVVNQIPAWVAGFVGRHHLESQICVANDPGPDFDGAMLHELLTHPADEQVVIGQLVHLVQGTPFDGINFDFSRTAAT